MNRTIIIILGIACALLTAAGCGSLAPTQEKTADSKRIKTIIKFSYTEHEEAPNQDKWKEPPHIRMKKYNTNGKIIEESNGEPEDFTKNYLYKTIYKYDESNNLIEEINFDGHGRQQHKEILEYESNKLVKKVSYPDWSGCRWEATFDYYKDGRLRSENTFIYDHITTDAKILSKKRVTYTYKFDEKNNLVEQGESYEFEYPEKKSKTKIVQTLHYKYDNLGRKIEEIAYDESGKIHEKFDDNNSSCLQLIAKTGFKYDEKGNILEISNYNTKSELLSREKNEYDEYGWLKLSEYFNTMRILGVTDDKEFQTAKVIYWYELYPSVEKK